MSIFIGNDNTYVSEFKKDVKENNGIFRIISEDEHEWRIWSDNRYDHEWILSKKRYEDVFKEIPTFEITIEEGQCKTTCCPFVCQWMHHKNPYLNQELVNIRKMSNQIDYSNFNTSVKIIYELTKNKCNVDKYLH